jgi:hypothetical protein
MLRKFLTSFTTVCILYFSSYAQSDSTVVAAAVSPSPTITGSIDVYYRYNFANPKFGGTNNYTSFTNSQNSFELGMASIKADHSFGKASATIDLGFGRRAEEFSYPDGNGTPQGSGNGFTSLASIKQAYLSYAISDKFKLTMGKWATHIGYELVDAYLNRNYSMDYMFSFGPFSHTGLKADIGLGGKSALMLGIANTTDNVTTTASPKFIIGQFSTASSDSKFKAYLNFQEGASGGDYKLVQGDVVLTYAATDKFNLGYNGTVVSKNVKNNLGEYGDAASWWGSALYLNFDPVSTFGLTLRGEYFNDKPKAGFFGNPPPEGTMSVLNFGTSIFDITLSPNIKVGNLTIIPELRLDAAKDKIFEKNDGTGTKSTVTALLAATYHF